MRTSILTFLVAAAAIALLAREAAPDAWTVPALGRAAILAGLVVALAAVVARGRRAGAAWAASCLLVLAAATALRFVALHPDPDTWRAGEEARLRARFERVRTELLARESGARALAREARSLLPDSTAVPLGVEERARLFEALERVRAGGTRALPGAIAAAGVQLFDAQGELVAWAGTPHALESSVRLTRFAGGTHGVYFRRGGVYTLLTAEVRDASTLGRGAADSAGVRRPPGRLRVLVDLPIEVHYQINNRFLQSRSLDDELSGDGVEVEFVYDAPAIPPYLTQTDLELTGDQHRGVQGLGLVRDTEGVALALCRLSGLPHADATERAAARLDLLVRLLLAVGLALGWVALGRMLLATSRPRLHRFAASPVLPIAALWSVRFLLALLGLPPSRLGGSLFDPAKFAMVGFGGVLRTPFDLLLTAVALAASAWLVLLHAARVSAARATPSPAPTRPPAARAASGTLLATLVVGFTIWAAFHFVGRVAGDSNPLLLGPQLDLLSPPVTCMHLGLLAGVAAWLALAILAAGALRGAGGAPLVSALALLALAVFLWRSTSPLAALAGAGVLLASYRVRSLLHDDRFTSLALAAFALVAATATLDADAIHREYFRGNQGRVQETVDMIRDPSDDMRRFVLEDVLQKSQADPALQAALQSDRAAERGALAFQLWAESMLSHMGLSCQVSVHDPFGQLVSEFAIDMPASRDVGARDLLEQARRSAAPVLSTEPAPPAAGAIRSYSGAAAVRSGSAGAALLGTVLVELPFTPASLELAANPRSRTPEVLRNLQEEGVGPRIDESERLLLAWLERGFVVESSTPYLEVGQAPRGRSSGTWERLRLVNGTYLVTRVPAGERQRELLAGFRLASPLDRLLAWTQLASFSFAVTLLGLLVFLVSVRGTRLGRRLPPLLVPKRLGFQQKLMMAFLVVSLLPGVVLSVATRDVMRDRSLSRNREAALAKVRAAEAALADMVRRDLDAVRQSEYLHAVLTASEAPPARDIGDLEFSQIMVLRGDGRIVLDETLSSLSDEDARQFVHRAPPGIFASRDIRYLCVGALEKIWFSPTDGLSDTAPDASPYWVYYRRRLTDRLLRNLAPILSTDLSAFLGPNLVVSSQKSLATAGLLPSLVPPQAFAHVQLRRNRYAVVEESAGRQHYFAGYLPLESFTGERIGSLAVSQLLQPDEFAVEVERTRQLVLGLSTLMFALTLVLGVFFAARIFDPVRSLIEGTRRIAGGDLGFRLRARAGDEIGELERSFNDMSERLLTAHRALDERRRYLEAVLGHIASGVVATDAEGRITAANPAAYRILRLPAGSLEGRSWTDLAAAAGGGKETEHFWHRLGEAPGGEVLEIPVRGGDAAARDRLTLRVIITDLLPQASEAGERLGRVAIFEDVTELIRSKKLSAWAEMARQVAHEIKNPLTPMKLSAQFMQQAFYDKSEKFPQIFQEGMTTIVQQVESLRRIASEFSNFGRVQKLQPRPLDLRELLRGVTAPYRKIDGLELELHDEPIDGLRVRGDDEGLRRVFRNVLENAREAMGGRGRITLHVERAGDDRVLVRIADQGPGVSEEAATRLFEPYFSTKTTGTGLGLAISRSIVEELGGTIVLANRHDGGAEARVTLALC